MMPLDFLPSNRMIACVEGAPHPLILDCAGDAAVLADAANARFNPSEAQSLDWPPEAEADLRRGGYLPVLPPDDELWCNCAD